MKTVAVIDQKGGTGKTTIALDLAVEAPLKPPALPPSVITPQRETAYPLPPSRQGRRHVGVWLAPATWRTLRTLVTRDGRSAQSLLEEAVADLLRKHGMPASD